MTAKTPTRQAAFLASWSLRIAGIIILLAALLDILILPYPYQPLSRPWQVSFVTQFVDRGIVPMVGLALFFTGYWVDSLSGVVTEKRKVWQDGRFWAVLLASLLGLLYLLMAPLHFNNVRISSQEALARVEQQASQAESQSENQLTALIEEQRGRLDQLLSNEDLLNQALQSGQVSEEQATLLEQFKQDPNSLEAFVEERRGELETRLQGEIGTRREQAEQAIRNEAQKSSFRIGLGSLLLAIGYILIGWTGLKALGQVPSKRSSV